VSSKVLEEADVDDDGKLSFGEFGGFYFLLMIE
jgi:hypothetical protein